MRQNLLLLMNNCYITQYRKLPTHLTPSTKKNDLSLTDHMKFHPRSLHSHGGHHTCSSTNNSHHCHIWNSQQRLRWHLVTGCHNLKKKTFNECQSQCHLQCTTFLCFDTKQNLGDIKTRLDHSSCHYILYTSTNNNS